MPVVSVKVSDELKKRMEKFKHINWSEILREAIIKTLDAEEGRDLARAVLYTEKVRKKAPKGWDSAKEIRYWRDKRYGQDRN
ncbi:MAG: hypothetical protein ACP6IP_10550 [Candidatus Njordarchaeia archaeon]